MHAMRRKESTAMAFMLERSITMPPSFVPYPAILWPPLRTATGSCWLRANGTALITSFWSAQRTIKVGYLSIIPFQTLRALW